ncbi:hypothetical protein ABZP36_023585 [Zizania latifolia]
MAGTRGRSRKRHMQVQAHSSHVLVGRQLSSCKWWNANPSKAIYALFNSACPAKLSMAGNDYKGEQDKSVKQAIKWAWNMAPPCRPLQAVTPILCTLAQTCSRCLTRGICIADGEVFFYLTPHGKE